MSSASSRVTGGSDYFTYDQAYDLLKKREVHFRSAVAAVIRKGAQFGFDPLEAIAIAFEAGFIGCDDGGWYSISVDENNLSLEDILCEQKPDGKATSNSNWVTNPLFNKRSSEFLNFTNTSEIHQFRDYVEQQAFERISNIPVATKFRFLTPEQVLNLPPLQFLIDGVLPEKAISYIFGSPGEGKSAVVLNMAVSIASGQKWHTDRETRAGTVVYLTAEGFAGLSQRLAAIQFHDGIDVTKIPLVYATDVSDLPDQVDDLIRDILNVCASRKINPPSLIIIDTLARHLGGGRSENDTAEMGAYVVATDKLRSGFDCHVMSVHHSGKDPSKGARGSSALHGAVDTAMQAKTKDGIQTIMCIKQRDAEEFDPIAFKFKEVEVPQNEGPPIKSFVLVPEKDAPTRTRKVGASGTSKNAKAENTILEALKDGIPRRHGELVKFGNVDLTSEPAAKRAITNLLNAGLIVKEGTGYVLVAISPEPEREVDQ